MADHADNFDGDIFIYRGGRAPQHTTHVLIDKSVDEIEDKAFGDCNHLVHVETHDGIRRIGEWAFFRCTSLRRINLKSAVEIGKAAFFECENLESVEFGDRLETIGKNVFSYCDSLKLKHLKLPSIITIGQSAFSWQRLTAVELSERLETIGIGAFSSCDHLQRIAIPLKRDLFVLDDELQRYDQFDGCKQLATVDLVGGIHKTVASLHMDSWRTEMIAEINRINQVLSSSSEQTYDETLDLVERIILITSSPGKTDKIQEWMEVVMDKMDHYKAEHHRYVNEGITLLELALWKAELLCENEDRCSVQGQTNNVQVACKSARKVRRVTCGADIVIKNVLPFLQLE